MKDLYLIYKNLTRKPLRLFLTCFAIFIAFLIFGAVSTLKTALDAGIDLTADNRLMVVNRINFTNPLPISYVNKIRSIDGVDKVTHANWFGGYFKDPKNQIVTMAVDAETYLDVYEELIVDPAQKENWLKNRQGALVGAQAAAIHGWKVGDLIPISSNIFTHRDGGYTWDFVVEGIGKNADQNADTNVIVFHYDYFRETKTFDNDYIGWVVLTTKDKEMNSRIAEEIDEMFANSPFETDTATEKAFVQAFVSQIGNIGLIIFSVVFMAFFTILLMVGNTMVLAIRERTSEIAVLKTLGFSASRIFKMILAESMLLSFLGGLLGLGGAYVMITVAATVLAKFLPGLAMSSETAVQAILYMAALGLITGLTPAISAYRLNIIEAFSRR